MRLSYVTVAVNYLDFLRVSVHHNRGQFDDMVVVTSLRDPETSAWLQAQKDITPVYTDAFYEPQGVRFNKGAGLNVGLNALQATLAEQGARPEWVALMDADTFVPPDWREILKRANLDKEYMYGARRVLLPTWEDYEGLWSRDLDSYVCPDGHSFGWLQLIHWDSVAFQSLPQGRWYPEGPDCREVDWRFREYWGSWAVPYTVTSGKLAELPCRVFNLGEDGRNHFGRVSSPFAPPPSCPPPSPSSNAS